MDKAKQLIKATEDICQISQNIKSGKRKGNSISLVGGSLSLLCWFSTLKRGPTSLMIIFAAGTAYYNHKRAKEQTDLQNECLNNIQKIVIEDDNIKEDIRHTITMFETVDGIKEYSRWEGVLSVLRGLLLVIPLFDGDCFMTTRQLTIAWIKTAVEGFPACPGLLGSRMVTSALAIIKKELAQEWIGGFMIGTLLLGCAWDAYHCWDSWKSNGDRESSFRLDKELRKIVNKIQSF